MNIILINQNKSENIKRLAAQRQLYTECKKLLIIQLIVTIPGTVLFALLKLIPRENLGFDISPYSALYGVVIFIVDLFVLTYLMGQNKTEAARIQEAFDCDVYNMQWNSFFAGKQPSLELINKMAARYIEKPNAPLTDWYPIEIEGLTHENSILICQRTNLYYDNSLRIWYKRAAIWTASTILFLLVLDAIIGGFSFREFLTVILLPFMPVLTVTIKIMFDHTKSLKSATDLHVAVKAVEEKGHTPTMQDLRDIQNKIFCHRKDSPLIPDFIYYFLREKGENEMHENALR